MKHIRIILLLILAILFVVSVAALSACNNDNPPDNKPSDKDTPTIDPSDKDFSGITFDGLTIDYDGQEHEITVSGNLPEGASVEYASNKATNAGIYNATATVKCQGYKTLTLNATLTINKLDYDMSGVEWDYSQAFIYNGEVRTVTIKGELPDGVSVKNYSNNSKTDAGVYTASVAFNYDEINHNAPQVANCSWTIDKADIDVELTLADSSVEYDALPHSIQIVGNVPAGVVAVYYYNNVETNEVTAVGEYSVKCILSGKNYNEKVLNATLKIKSTEERLFSVVTSNGKVYFQNNLDDNKLYTVSGGNVVKISNDIPNHMITNNNDLYYFSTSLFSKVIKNYNGASASTLYSANGEYLTTDGTYIYYAINNLILNTDQNGIYKIKLDGTDETPTRLVADKAEYLTYSGSYIYYSNKSDGGKLYRVSVNENNGQGTQLRTDKKDEKVSYIISDGTNLYFNSTKTAVAGIGIAAAICKYNISSGKEVKLTTDSGKYLTKIDGYIYYVNNDKITSALFGDGIYKVSALATSDNNLAGTKVLSSDNDGYSSLASDGASLYYYKLNDKHFYKNSSDGQNEIDLMLNFQPIDDTVLVGYSQLAEYNGEIYFTNPLDNGCLYKYNVATKAKYKVLADSVSNISFYSYEGKTYMYYSTYILTNYALFRMDLSTNEIEKVTSKRVENLIFEGDKIYCTRVSGTINYLLQMDLDGSNEVELYKKTSLEVIGLEKHGDTFYWILDPATFGYKNVCIFHLGDKDKVDLHRASNFVILDDKIYFFAHATDHSGSDNKEAMALKVCNLDGTNTITLKKDVDITYMYASDKKVYFVSKSSQNSGLFVYDIEQKKVTKISDKFAHGMTVLDGKLYFLQSKVEYTLDYAVQDSSCDGHLYCYDGTEITKVA